MWHKIFGVVMQAPAKQPTADLSASINNRNVSYISQHDRKEEI